LLKMNRFGAWITGGLLLLGSTVLPGPLAPSAACAAEGPRAVLVVDTGESEASLCVALPKPSVSGLDLIELAGEQHGLSYRFGYGGNAVCMLAGVGTTGDDCFEKYPDFWGYWRGDGSGGWSWSGSGAGSTTVEDGDVEGWSWGSGSNGDTHPRPPATSYNSVCPAAPRPRDEQSKPRSRTKSSTDSHPNDRAPRPRSVKEKRTPVAMGAGEDGQDQARRRGRPNDPERAAVSKRKPKKQRGRRALRSLAPPSAPPTPTIAAEIVAARLRPTGSTGPPVAGVAALVAAALLGGAGFVLARRRRSA
jgi:LPXTG-motif cell wall-anchored protein